MNVVTLTRGGDVVYQVETAGRDGVGKSVHAANDRAEPGDVLTIETDKPREFVKCSDGALYCVRGEYVGNSINIHKQESETNVEIN